MARAGHAQLERLTACETAPDLDHGQDGGRVRSQQIRRLVEVIIGASFADYVEPRRTAGRSWQDIAEELTADLRMRCRRLGLPEDVQISRETVRRWYMLPR